MTSVLTMTTPPGLGRRRLATVADAVEVFRLCNEPMAKNFRIEQVSDVQNLIEYSTPAIVQLSRQNTIIGFVAVKDHPLLPSVHPSAWEHYMWTKYKSCPTCFGYFRNPFSRAVVRPATCLAMKQLLIINTTVDMTARNTLFIHLLCWTEPYGRELVEALLTSLFMHDSYLMNIAFIKSLNEYPVLMPGHSRCEGAFHRVTCVERGVPTDSMPSLVVAERADVCPRLRVRRAVEEDNDDLVPIIDRHSKRLRELYGEFYISELIARHPESERVLLVGEHKELAVGVMILNTVINYEALEESYDLSPFAGLRHLSAEPKVNDSDSLRDEASALLVETPMPSRMEDLRLSETSHKEKEEVKRKALSWVSKDTYKSDLSFGDIPPSLQCIDKDEDIDFDIVNIDHHLLRVPRSLSADMDIELGPAADMLNETKDYMQPPCGERSSDTKLKKFGNNEITPELGTHSVARYTGSPNAFLLEVFAMHPDYDERYGFDILEAAYEMFPDRDYCVLCLPSEQPAFPLLEHFTLVAPTHCREKYTNQSLYVAHVNSVRERVAVRRAEAYDFPAMSDILEQAPHQHTILQLLEKSLLNPNLDAYVMLSQHQPVGLMILGQLDNVTGVRTQYDLSPQPRQPDGDGAILAGILLPALEPHGRWYIREILRLSKYTALFWLCQLMAKGSFARRNIMSLAGKMVPVAPRRRTVPNITGSKELDKVWNATTPFALWGIERPLTALPKVDVNNAIVVVGASRVGLAFIETLLMGPASQYLTFTNITLVSEQGLAAASECLAAAEICVAKTGRFTDRYIKSIPFYFYVDCITGVMKGIDRKKKCIQLKGGGVKYYDVLVLTCGMQYQHPNYLAESFAHDKKTKKGSPCQRMLMDNPKYQPDRVPTLPPLPENVFIINSLLEANVSLKRLLRMISTANVEDQLSVEKRILVYGDCIQSYSTIAALIELGVPPNEIAFVEPFPPEDKSVMRVNCFNNEIIDERVQASLEGLKVHVYRQCRFLCWRTNGKNRVDMLEFMLPLKKLYIPCFAFFYYGLRAINFYAFKAISECGLVYDGGLVVDPLFRTNDPHVYGAGYSVQYSRRLHADRRSHKYYCSEDVGEALAKTFLQQMDPFVMGNPEAEYAEVLPTYRNSLLNYMPHPSIEESTRPSLEKHRDWAPVMEFDSPLMQWAVLPGPLYYLRVRRPGPDIPMEVELTLPRQGHLLTTDKDGNYFALRLNAMHCVESVTCLSKKPMPNEILTQIYGVHEAIFNKLLVRFMMNKIEDLYEYFVQPWMAALYMEAFGTMLGQICRQNVGTVFDLVKSHFALNLFNESEEQDADSTRSGSDHLESGTSVASCFVSSAPSCVYGSDDAPNLGSVHAVIEKFMRGQVSTDCGQSEKMRNEAKSFWTAMRGDRIVTAHLARYLDRYRVPNPQYAKISPDLI